MMTKKVLCLVLLTSLLVLLASAAFALQVGANAPAFRLADQFGKVWNLADLSGKVVVIIAADRDSGRAMGPWMDNLKRQYSAKTQILGLMGLSGIPGFARGIARSRIKSETQDPLMIDFSGPTAAAYSVSGKYPVVIVIDKGGVVRDIEKTSYTKDAFSAASSAIDKALKG